ncbi:MAG: hypothetical protein QOH49_3886 [Acidobacteriota bacterium]|jgi:hypothetical protein|nr:hypothetical protein [Acidobacteriota bacterium]
MDTEFSNLTNIQILLVVDLIVLSSCATALILLGRLAHSHPATIYLAFHLLTVTLRLLALSFGAPTLLTEYTVKYGLYIPVSLDEIIKAAFLADVACVLMTIAWIKAAADAHGESATRIMSPPLMLSPKILKVVVAVVFPIGVVGILLFARLPTLSDTRVELGAWEPSSWVIIMVSWAGLVILALIYCYGFRHWLSLMMLVYLLLMAYQGFHRFRVVIPVILMAQIYLDRNRLKWPRPRVAIVLLTVALLFYPLKGLGVAVQKAFDPSNTQEVSVSNIANDAVDGISKALAGQSGDQQFLDQFALYMALIDAADKMYYGKTYLPLITMPIPRQWWPEKPGLMDWVKDISRPWRPVFEMGMIMTFFGECYANFGVAGILVMPALFAYCSGRIYFYAYRRSYFSVVRFAYLLLACNLIQIYRDGFISIVILTVVDMMPLVLIILLHYIQPLLVRAPRLRSV